MVDNRQAFMVMGNHEFNAICFFSKNRKEKYLRPHNAKNLSQHRETLKEIERIGETAWEKYLDWFRGMPLFLEMDGFRIVHACWDQRSIEFLKKSKIRNKKGELTFDFFEKASKPGNPLFNAVENLLKGIEVPLPAPFSWDI